MFDLLKIVFYRLKTADVNFRTKTEVIMLTSAVDCWVRIATFSLFIILEKRRRESRILNRDFIDHFLTE